MSEVEAARYWLSWIHWGGTIALALVAIGVGYEFIENRLAAPLEAILEKAHRDEIEQLRAQVAEANARAAEANRIAEQERLERAKLERRVADRRLTDSQKHRIRDALAPHPGYTAVVISRLADPEGQAYGGDFRDAFVEAKWNALWSIDWLRNVPVVSIATVAGAKTPEIALLDAALTTAEIPHEVIAIGESDIHSIGGAGFQQGITYLLISRHQP